MRVSKLNMCEGEAWVLTYFDHGHTQLVQMLYSTILLVSCKQLYILVVFYSSIGISPNKTGVTTNKGYKKRGFQFV